MRRAILHALVIGVPIFFLRFTLDPINVPKLALLSAGCIIVAGIRIGELLQGASAQNLLRLWMPATMLAAPLVFSWVLSPYRDWATFGLQPRLQGLIPYLVVIAFAILLADAFAARAEELALSLCWAGAIVGVYAVIQTVGMDPFRWSLLGAQTQAASTTGNPNFTGGFLAIVLPVGAALAIADATRRRIIVRLLVMVGLGWAVSRSHGAWAAGLAGVALVVAYQYRERHRLARSAGIAAAAMFGLLTVGAVVIAIVQPTGRFAIGTAVVRAGWWQSALDMATSHPIAGRGPNSFALEGVSHRPLNDALRFSFDFPDDPHSVPLAMFANLGALGFVGFVAILGFAIWRFIQFRAPRLLVVGFFGAVVAYFIQSSVSIDELTLRLALWVGLAGLVAIDPRAESQPHRKTAARAVRERQSGKSPLRAPVLVGLVAVATAIALALPVTLVIADAMARAAEDAFGRDDPRTGRERLQRAIELRDSYIYRAELAFEMRDLALNEAAPDQLYYDEAVRAFRSFLDDAPFVFSLVSYGRLLDAWAVAHGPGGDPDAIVILHTAMRIDPRNPLIRADLATALIHLDRYEEALAVLEPHIDVVPRDSYGPYWSALALSAAEVRVEEVARLALRNAQATAADSEFTRAALRTLDRQD